MTSRTVFLAQFIRINSTDNCVQDLAALPAVEEPGKKFDGLSQGCRGLHAVFAETNPENHCAHISFTPVEDPKGRIKCQDSSSEGVQPEDLFDEGDLNRFSQFCIEHGLDPALAHNFDRSTLLRS